MGGPTGRQAKQEFNSRFWVFLQLPYISPQRKKLKLYTLGYIAGLPLVLRGCLKLLVSYNTLSYGTARSNAKSVPCAW
ncbi:uncharacterized protein PHALS_00440 [Plasmopara halstedii]|uniref:Uncharacterized protein n=1 Tax=Plasmopara halstedii TaxID=4781 RepID=A0A0P1A7E8_PLAHL|nr:uncharacterized protein PHALS_00440 [Plasmopara halstedii]CEG36122.1 hypothetical protein PHALS_00440 [Plasmopara halstedii]|eukprot:XP_024572491.1 hypothetical protein PHALS_00440 [Plasmopara halstedii]